MLTFETKRNDLTLIAISFFAISAIGGISVFAHWWLHNAVDIATERAGLFVGIMAVVHGLGAALYTTQYEPRDGSQIQSPKTWTLHHSLCFALIQYLSSISLAALILDGGFMLRCFGVGLLAHGSLIAIIWVHRSTAPTVLDLGLIRYGYLPIALIIWRAVVLVQQWNEILSW